MATVREYYDSDPKAMSLSRNWAFEEQGKVVGQVVAKVALNFDANAKYWYIYVPNTISPKDLLKLILKLENFHSCELGPDGNGLEVAMGDLNLPERHSFNDLVFTKFAYFYVDWVLRDEDRMELIKYAKNNGILLSVFDRSIAQSLSDREKPLAFISHDSRDKDLFVRKLANSIIRKRCPVWYDEYSLEVGDSLRESIESGLKETKKCVLILSPNFLSNEGWAKKEFDTVFTREILKREKIILPVWHNVSKEQVYDFSPSLAEKVAIPSDIGIEKLASKLAGLIKAKS